MAFTYIDMERYPRAKHFAYFRAMAQPYVGVTANVDVTELVRRAKANGHSFFLTALYVAANGANSVPELRQRIRGEGIVEYDTCDTSHTVALEDGTYAYCRLDCRGPFAEFLPRAQAEQQRVKAHPSLEDGDDGESLFFVSCLPWLSYTALVQPTPEPADSNPRITFGRYFSQGDRLLMPVTLLANHALVDGLHIARFYQAFEDWGKRLCGEA